MRTALVRWNGMFYAASNPDAEWFLALSSCSDVQQQHLILEAMREANPRSQMRWKDVEAGCYRQIYKSSLPLRYLSMCLSVRIDSSGSVCLHQSSCRLCTSPVRVRVSFPDISCDGVSDTMIICVALRNNRSSHNFLPAVLTGRGQDLNST